MKPKSKLLIFDGNAIVHRSFHALPPTMTTKSGEQVNAVYGFANFLLKAIKEFQASYCAVAFDLKGPTFRHVEYEAYKATRVKAPQELYDQFDRVKEIVRILNIPIYEASGYEADDVIGTIAKTADQQIDTIIVTGDMDAIQLVDDSTFVYAMSRGISESVLYDKAAVRARYEFDPVQLIDYKALRGDTADNIPGVRGIGEKTGTELIKEFGNIEDLYQAIDNKDLTKLKNLKARTIELLVNHRADAVLSKRLATIRCDVPLDFDLAACRFGDFNLDKSIELFDSLEFKSLLPRLKELCTNKSESSHSKSAPSKQLAQEEKTAQQPASVAIKTDCHLIDSEADFKNFLTTLSKQKSFAISSVSCEADRHPDQLLGLSFSWLAGEAYFINLAGVNSASLFASSAKDEWLKALGEVLSDSQIKKYGHNIKAVLKSAWSAGLELRGISGDMMIASYLLNPDSNKHDLSDIALKQLNFTKITKEELLGTGKQKINLDQVALGQLAKFSAEEADLIWRLSSELEAALVKEELKAIYDDIELPLITVLARMENYGVILDRDYLHKLDKATDKNLTKLTKQIYELAGKDFNINSVKQLQEVLFTDLAIPTKGIAKTKTGYSTGADELEKMKEMHTIVPLILEYRELSKLSSTYIKSLPKLVNERTGRLHTSYNQTIAATGRLSSINPNLQNIPMRTELGRQMRGAFVADRGKLLLSLDYSQIELRLAAHMSGDQTMIETFRAGGDIHTATAAKINNVAIEAITSDMRRAAKAINFGLLYGQGPHGLAQTAGISYGEARSFIDAYFASFSSVKNYMDSILVEARTLGYVRTLAGRRRYLPLINSPVIMLAKAAERAAINAPIQGTAADMIKMAMLKVDELLEQSYKGKVKMIMQVHDELVFEVETDLVEELTKAIKPLMENVLELDVPIVVEAKVGQNWEEMDKLA